MSEQNIKGIMDTTMEKIRAMVDSDTIIGDPIVLDGTTIIPVSKVAFGLATGGSDFAGKGNNTMFGGGGGAGVTITPVSFVAVSGESIRVLPITNEVTSLDKAINMAPELIDKVKSLFSKKENNEEE